MSVFHIARHSAARRRKQIAASYDPIREAVESLLTADEFDAAVIETLARREHYAHAANVLNGAAQRPYHPLVEILHDSRVPEPVLILRVGLWARFITNPSGSQTFQPSHVTRETLRKKAACNRKARLTLAALGEIDWPSADRQCRAAFCLAELVRVFRERSP
jgi:hypothetical protein